MWALQRLSLCSLSSLSSMSSAAGASNESVRRLTPAACTLASSYQWAARALARSKEIALTDVKYRCQPFDLSRSRSIFIPSRAAGIDEAHGMLRKVKWKPLESEDCRATNDILANDKSSVQSEGCLSIMSTDAIAFKLALHDARSNLLKLSFCFGLLPLNSRQHGADQIQRPSNKYLNSLRPVNRLA